VGRGWLANRAAELAPPALTELQVFRGAAQLDDRGEGFGGW